MSVYLYDNAIVNQFKEIINDERIYITPAENVIRTMARLNEDEVKFPMISLTRTGTRLLPSQFSMRYNGYTTFTREEDMAMQKLQAMPIRINYQIDIWTRNREENDNLVRELVFYLSTHPQMYVTIPYGLDTYEDKNKHVFSMFLDDTIDDNSDILNHQKTGEYFRQTLSAYVDDAYLWKTTNTKIPTVDSVTVKSFALSVDGSSEKEYRTKELEEESKKQ